MNASRLFAAAFAAALVSSAALAAPPPASQVTVSPQPDSGMRHAKLEALLPSPAERAMFKMQMREATHGMTHDQKKAYRHAQIGKIRAMSAKEKAAWLKDLDAKWAALPQAKRTRIAQKMEARAAKHASASQSMQADPDQGTAERPHPRRGAAPQPAPSDQDQDDDDDPQ
jgi:hypothetical protein